MSVQTPDYPTQYRGNEIYDEKKVRELNPEHKPNLSLVTGTVEVNEILDHIGVEHDPDSIVLEDSYNCLWVDVEDGEYVEVEDSQSESSHRSDTASRYHEVWGIHKSVPHLDRVAVRLK